MIAGSIQLNIIERTDSKPRERRLYVLYKVRLVVSPTFYECSTLYHRQVSYVLSLLSLSGIAYI